ncbi:response regulator transcription factor [Rhodoblastus sp.]|uniref:helix-turn-helix transcriptional regulator n=1 Tax=Rhodoblastus sp. TaxID=1962975 RepID=UPI003F975E13
MTLAKNSRGLAPKAKALPPFSPLPGVALRSERASPCVGTSQDGRANHEQGDGVESVFARQVRLAYSLLQSAIEEAAEAAESRNVTIASDLEELQARAIRSIQDSALATIDLFEALGALQTPGELASRQIELARRQRDSVTRRLDDFFETAKTMVSIMTDPLNRQMRAFSGALAAERGPSEAGDTVLSRLNKLTARQKRVLELLAEGLPNKVIAHELGISETTVKAHVGEILRKLKVYNRARAIVMLAQFDMRQIRALAADDASESE